jgi:hypothetical protein
MLVLLVVGWLLVAPTEAAPSFVRREVVLEFHMTSGSLFARGEEENTGTAHSQTHISGTTGGQLCYTWLEDEDSSAALLVAHAQSFPNGLALCVIPVCWGCHSAPLLE